MSQNKTPTIDPTIISGTQLTGIIDDNTDTELTTNSGTMRPAYAKAGTLWLNTANAALWDLNFFDGSVDVTLGQIDPVAHTYVGFGTDQYLLQDGSEPMLGALKVDQALRPGTYTKISDNYTELVTPNFKVGFYCNNAVGGLTFEIFNGATYVGDFYFDATGNLHLFANAPLAANHATRKDFVESGVSTLTNKTLTSPVLNGGLSGTAFLDDDTMAADSAIAVASQQSIKTYVDELRAYVDAERITGNANQVFVGEVTSAGTASGLPPGWTASKVATGQYLITHNMGLSSTNKLAVSASARTIPANRAEYQWNTTNNFYLYSYNTSNVLVDGAISFMAVTQP